MAFKIANMRSAKERPTEQYITTDNEVIALGEALVLTSGALTKCGATAVPEFIAMESAADQAIINVVRITEDMVFETTFAADASAEEVGELVTLHEDGLQVTATNTNGVFYITKKLGTGAAGTKVLGMFRR